MPFPPENADVQVTKRPMPQGTMSQRMENIAEPEVLLMIIGFFSQNGTPRIPPGKVSERFGKNYMKISIPNGSGRNVVNFFPKTFCVHGLF
jgi:hypothetical protein